MRNLRFVQQSFIIIHEDNQACIESSNHNDHAESKNTQQRYHYTREIIEKGDIKVAYIPTSENPAHNIITVPLTPHNHFPQFHRLMVFLLLSGDNPDIAKF